jgi:hypothetical protein
MTVTANAEMLKIEGELMRYIYKSNAEMDKFIKILGVCQHVLGHRLKVGTKTYVIYQYTVSTLGSYLCSEFVTANVECCVNDT